MLLLCCATLGTVVASYFFVCEEELGTEPLPKKFEDAFTYQLGEVRCHSSIGLMTYEDAIEDGRWKDIKGASRAVIIRNESPHSFWLYGSSLSGIHVGLCTKKPDTGEWVDSSLGYCGTGVLRHEVVSGGTFSADVFLPFELKDREFKIRFAFFGLKDATISGQLDSPVLTMAMPSE